MDQFFKQSARNVLSAGHLLAIVFILQASLSPLMSQFGSNIQNFPQVVINEGSITSFTIHNPSAGKTISVAVQLYAPNGDALTDQQVELGPGETKSVSFGDANAALTRGWAELRSDDEFIATEFFQLFLGGLKPRVGVLQSPLSEEVKFLGFVNALFKSGLAIHNPSPTEATQVTVRVKDMAGQEPIPERTLALNPRQSEAVFLDDELLFGADLTDFEGVVEISVNSPPVAVLSLIQEANGDVTTVAVETQRSDQNGGQNGGQNAGTFHLFPMYVAGKFDDGSERDGAFFATNVDGRPTTCTVQLIGMPNTIFDSGGEGVLSLAIQGSAAFVGTVAERDPPGVEVGYATMTCDHAVTGLAFQSFLPPGGPPAERVARTDSAARSSLASILLALGGEGGITEVIAIVNNDSAAADFDVTVFDISDALVGTTRVNVLAKTQLVENIVDLIPVPTEDLFLGSIRISSVDNATRFYALGLAREGTGFTTIPATRLAP